MPTDYVERRSGDHITVGRHRFWFAGVYQTALALDMDQGAGTPGSLPVKANHQKGKQELEDRSWSDRDHIQLPITGGGLGNLIATTKKSTAGYRD
jgi:hypothetical protein